MRRRLQEFLPIVLIALAMQILAPVAACWASAITASDPLQAAVICHDNSGKADQPGEQGPYAAGCSVCCLAQADFSLDVPQPGFSLPVRQADRVVWLDTDSSLAISRVGSNTRARGPPQVT